MKKSNKTQGYAGSVPGSFEWHLLSSHLPRASCAVTPWTPCISRLPLELSCDPQPRLRMREVARLRPYAKISSEIGRRQYQKSLHCDTNNSGIRHTWVLQQLRLELGGRDLESLDHLSVHAEETLPTMTYFDFDELLHTIDDIKHSLFVQVTDISASQPTVRGKCFVCCFLIPPISFHNIISL